MKPTRPKPIPIRPWNLPLWAAKTVGQSLSLYRPNPRPLAAGRLLRLPRPNLRQPIFVFGAARSGTTFLGNCLGALPEISYHHEPVATKAVSRYVSERLWPPALARLFYRSIYGWLMRLHLDADLRLADKTPRNCLIVGFLSDAFPGSQFVHIIRDGRDSALSLAQQPWLSRRLAGLGLYEPGGYPMGPYARSWVERERVNEFERTTDIHGAIWVWRIFTTAAVKAGAQLPPHRYHELRYESLMSHPETEAGRLLDFLGIVSPASRERFHRGVAQADSASVGRWRQALDGEALRQIEAEAGPLLRDLGYGG